MTTPGAAATPREVVHIAARRHRCRRDASKRDAADGPRAGGAGLLDLSRPSPARARQPGVKAPGPHRAVSAASLRRGWADQSLHSPTPGLNPCNSGCTHLGRAKEHALAESVSVAEYFDIEAHALTKAHDLDVRVRDDGLDAVTQT